MRLHYDLYNEGKLFISVKLYLRFILKQQDYLLSISVRDN